MYITRKKFEEICKRYNTLIISDSDAVDACNFVHDLLEAEADATKEKAPYATKSIALLNEAAYEVFSFGGGVDLDEFEED